MRNYFSTVSILALSVLGLFAPTVKADERNKHTNIKIDQPIEIEGTVIPAGSYVLKLADPADHTRILISNAEENRVIATVFTTPTYQTEPPEKSEFKFYISEAGRPPALHAWFYPGDSTGFEFREVPRAPTVAAAQRSGMKASNASSN